MHYSHKCAPNTSPAKLWPFGAATTAARELCPMSVSLVVKHAGIPVATRNVQLGFNKWSVWLQAAKFHGTAHRLAIVVQLGTSACARPRRLFIVRRSSVARQR